ncbi:uncharacterized protein LOC127584759 [Pristis pectinata]|uniref:uncharacterized protein LOC127584759 n=1 Tax=Pristis pectinata TaxID=685728 RepID=UPI00223E106E|nr:uncharacterized protein LOC127584759 [Pristis pectinata]XP_051897652.1 uncharacterized protein LOC127584759 [Pristis pectinata]
MRPWRTKALRRRRTPSAVSSFFDFLRLMLSHCKSCLMCSKSCCKSDWPCPFPVVNLQATKSNSVGTQTSFCTLPKVTDIPQTITKDGKNSGALGISVPGSNLLITFDSLQTSAMACPSLEVSPARDCTPTAHATPVGPLLGSHFDSRPTQVPVVRTTVIQMESQPLNAVTLILTLTTIAYACTPTSRGGTNVLGHPQSGLRPSRAYSSPPLPGQLATRDSCPSSCGQGMTLPLSMFPLAGEALRCPGGEGEGRNVGLVEEEAGASYEDLGWDKEGVLAHSGTSREQGGPIPLEVAQQEGAPLPLCPLKGPLLEVGPSSCGGQKEGKGEGAVAWCWPPLPIPQDEHLCEAGQDEKQSSRCLAGPWDGVQEAESWTSPSLLPSRWAQGSWDPSEDLGSCQKSSGTRGEWESEPSSSRSGPVGLGTSQEWSGAFNTSLWVFDHFQDFHRGLRYRPHPGLVLSLAGTPSQGKRRRGGGLLGPEQAGPVALTHTRPRFEIQDEEKTLMQLLAAHSSPPSPVPDTQLVWVPPSDLEYWATFYFGGGVEAARRLLRERRGKAAAPRWGFRP